MQPYIFPYFGYFQLIQSVDTFLFLDDVNFKKRGWINRNKIWGEEEGCLFTIPLKKVSQNKHINTIELAWDEREKSKLIKKIQFTYQSAPHFLQVFPVLENIILKDYDSIAHLAGESIGRICEYLDMETILGYTSEGKIGLDLKGQHRILEICKAKGVKTYINTIAGLHIYGKSAFTDVGIDFFFHQPTTPIYQQKKNHTFVPNLSVIDVLMFNEKSVIQQWLNDYTLI